MVIGGLYQGPRATGKGGNIFKLAGSNMKAGAFALLDCLGFKGVWRRERAADYVLAKLDRSQEAATRMARASISKLMGQVDIKVAFLSDTVAIGVALAQDGELTESQRAVLVASATELSSRVANYFLEDHLPLPMRGSIVLGEFGMTDRFIVGPAVDEAASQERLAEGAFIWLSPNAAAAYDAYLSQFHSQLQSVTDDSILSAYEGHMHRFYGPDSRRSSLLEKLDDESRSWFSQELRQLAQNPDNDLLVLRDYPVPMKLHGNVMLHAINPLCRYIGAGVASVAHEYKQAMKSQNLAVVAKLQRTLKFIDDAKHVTMPILARYRNLEKELRTRCGIEGAE